MPRDRVTLRDVARLAGVHPGTASRALNAATRNQVNGATAQRVLEAALTLDFRPNPVARSLKTRRSDTVGVLIPDLTNPLFPPIVRGIEDHLAARGYVALIGNTDNDDQREMRVFEGMRSRQVDGFILATARRRHPLLLRAAEDELAVVLVNRVVDSHAFPSASVDDARGSRLAVAHLVGLGHRRLAHLGGPQALSTGVGRYQGFLAGMETAGLEVDPALVTFADGFSQQEGARRCRDLLRAAPRCTGVVVANDLLALGCYAALEEAGLRCPEDISIVGFNDMPFIDRVHPPLTSVAFSHYRIGAEAARLVLERIADRHGPVTATFLQPELVVRQSTGPPPGSG